MADTSTQGSGLLSRRSKSRVCLGGKGCMSRFCRAAENRPAPPKFGIRRSELSEKKKPRHEAGAFHQVGEEIRKRGRSSSG